MFVAVNGIYSDVEGRRFCTRYSLAALPRRHWKPLGDIRGGLSLFQMEIGMCTDDACKPEEVGLSIAR